MHQTWFLVVFCLFWLFYFSVVLFLFLFQRHRRRQQFLFLHCVGCVQFRSPMGFADHWRCSSSSSSSLVVVGRRLFFIIIIHFVFIFISSETFSHRFKTRMTFPPNSLLSCSSVYPRLSNSHVNAGYLDTSSRPRANRAPPS